MRRVPFLSIPLVLIGLLAVPMARAQPGEPDRMVEELAGIRGALSRIVQLLEAAQTRGEADLLLRRIEVMERRIAPLQSDVSQARSEIRGIESELLRLRTMEADLESQIAGAIRAGTDWADSPERAAQGQVRMELKQYEEQLVVAEHRERVAADSLATAREGIEALDAALLQTLERQR
jgi:hypothetical protein